MFSVSDIKNIYNLVQSKQITFSTLLFSSLAFIGIILAIIFSFLKKNIGTGLLVGYCITFFSTGFLFLVSPNISFTELLFPLFISILIGAIIYQTGTNLKKVNRGKLPGDYYKFSTIISFILGGLVSIYLYNIYNSLSSKNSSNLARNLLISGLMFLITIFMIYSNQIILTDFTTDG